VEGEARLDLDYEDDVAADVDMNVVMTGQGLLVEVQGTAERVPFSRRDLNDLLDLAESGIAELLDLQLQAAEA
jgi:ribonuclease PH